MGRVMPNQSGDRRKAAPRRARRAGGKRASVPGKESFAGGMLVNAPSPRGRRRRRRRSETVPFVTDGPFAESKEMLGASAWYHGSGAQWSERRR